MRNPGRDVTHWFELSVAPWWSTVVCDPQSTPLTPCTPRSDANAPRGNDPGGGAAFVELQFYPPGFAPFADSISCDNTHWCSALTIDSLECTAGSGSCNNNCVEPVNFAFIQTNGVPPGPASPQRSNLKTVSPNARTLLMNPGDTLKVRMFDARVAGGHALEAQETDVTTGQTGFMIASAANGFMNTNPFDCTGTPFNFEPAYSSARAQNIVPWRIGPYMINNQFEIGHFEPCTKITKASTVTTGSFLQRGSQRLEELLDPDLLHDRRCCRAVDPGSPCALVAPHPIPAHQKERRVGDEIEQIVEAAMRIITRPTVQLGLNLQYPNLGMLQRRVRLVGVHQRNLLAFQHPHCLTWWPPSPCVRLSRTPTASRYARDYYEASAPTCGHQPTTDLPTTRPGWTSTRATAGRFPRSPRNRSAREMPSSTPAASPRLRRRPSPWPPHRRN